MVMVNGTQTGGTNPQRGLVYGLLAAIFYAGVILLNKRITEVPVIEKTLVQMLASALIFFDCFSARAADGSSVVGGGAHFRRLCFITVHSQA